MNNAKYCQLIFVTETNDETESDDQYIFCLMKMYYGCYLKASNEELVLNINFIHMAGKTNYNQNRVLKLIRNKKNECTYGESIVIYCADTDSVSNDNNKLNSEITDFCSQNDFKLIFFSNEIEDIFDVPKLNGKKLDRVKYFGKNYPSKKSIDINNLKIEANDVAKRKGRSNFMKVMDSLIDELLEK